MTKLFSASIIFTLVCLTMASAHAQSLSPGSPTDVKVEKITDSVGACAGIMGTVFPVVCSAINVSAASSDPTVIGFVFVLLYVDDLGSPNVLTQYSFTRQAASSAYFVTSFPNFPNVRSIGVRPLSGGTPVWVTP
jgi:hypothetical protein